MTLDYDDWLDTAVAPVPTFWVVAGCDMDAFDADGSPRADFVSVHTFEPSAQAEYEKLADRRAESTLSETLIVGVSADEVVRASYSQNFKAAWLTETAIQQMSRRVSDRGAEPAITAQLESGLRRLREFCAIVGAMS